MRADTVAAEGGAAAVIKEEDSYENISTILWRVVTEFW